MQTSKKGCDPLLEYVNFLFFYNYLLLNNYLNFSNPSYRAEKYSLLPLGSSNIVFSPGVQFAGHTSSGFAATY